MSPLDPNLADALSKMMRRDLEVWSNWWFWSLVGSTIAVAIGIICEAPEVWQAVGLGCKAIARIRKFWYVRVRKIDLNGWERLCPELVTKNERHRKWIVVAGFVGWTLVALGVAGEGVAEYFVDDAETNLRAFDQAVLAETQQSANSAAMASSLANTFVGKAIAASSKALDKSKAVHPELSLARKRAWRRSLAISAKRTSGPNNFRLSRHWQLSRDFVRTEMTASMPSLANKILMSAKVALCDRIVLLYNVQRGIDLHESTGFYRHQ